jgi:hypothetical protein
MHVDVSNLGHVWGVNSGHNIFRRVDADLNNPAGTTWEHIEGGLVQITSHDFETWGVTSGHEVFRRTGIEETNLAGTGWMHITGIAWQHVSIGQKVLWAVDDLHNVFFGYWGEFTIPYEKPTVTPEEEVPEEPTYEEITVTVDQVEGALV